MLAENRWWFGSPEQFDDDEDFVFPGTEEDSNPRFANIDRERLAADSQNFMDQTGVFCLSESQKNRRLWQLYASDGAGLCVALESDHVTPFVFGPFRVSYSNRPKPLWKLSLARQQLLSQREREDLLAPMLQKRLLWAYQREWRCIRQWGATERATANRYFQIAPRALVGVIFGWCMTPDQCSKVRGWVDLGGWRRSVEFWSAELVGERITTPGYGPSILNREAARSRFQGP